ncbi:hypothetical protein [Ruegeria atlantica]|uniref:hypothetical protein n=1 Tax=Ruegeria atlantica TaxID=81569 RepID=UPI00147B1070|nr:hypothetical protein [Ruegeria atlantica]
MPEGGSLNFIALADLAARKARDEVIVKSISQPLARRFVTSLLDRPFLRPLLELEINGCTSFEGALLLVGQELAHATKFRCRSQQFRGEECEALEISPLGWTTLAAEQVGLEDNRWMHLFREAIQGYVCVDQGAGICMSRPLYETALEIPDPALLERVVFINNGAKQFPHFRSGANQTDIGIRQEQSPWWSTDGQKRSCVDVFDLSRANEVF